MNAWLLALIGGVYLWVAGGYFFEGRIGMGLTFVAYAVANVGFIVDLKQGA